jgi:hypothetical protein
LEPFERLVRSLSDIFKEAPTDLRDVRKILAVKRVLDGEAAEVVAADCRLQRRSVEQLVGATRERGLAGIIPEYDELTSPEELARRRRGIAQMLLGALAERRFEEISKEIAGEGVLRVEDHRPSRSDTDYRLLNGNDNPICRLNIKFHGSLFRDAPRYVGLQPDDCFALATYKIQNARRRQEQDNLPYVFVVLSVPELSATDVGRLVPDDYVWAVAVLGGKRVVEEEVVARLRSPDHLERFTPVFEKMPDGKFRVISASKTYQLLRDKLFERVHALSLKSFTRRFRNAEVDMHLSLSTELTPARTFFELLVKESPQKFAVMLYRGAY